MPITKCRECKKDVSVSASKCPHCGVDQPGLSKNAHGCSSIFSLVLMAVLFWWIFWSDDFLEFPSMPSWFESTELDASLLPHSNASYKETNLQVGCESKYSEAKKEDIFESRYKNHWMTWIGGRIDTLKTDEAGLDFDFHKSDLDIEFLDNNAGYNLKKDDVVSVKFVMRKAGGCFLPFKGDNASVSHLTEEQKNNRSNACIARYMSDAISFGADPSMVMTPLILKKCNIFK